MFDATSPADPRDGGAVSLAERARLDSLYRHQILDTAPDPRLDAITRIAAQALRVPIALVTFIDADRVWTKSSAGSLPLCAATRREDAFCTHLLSHPGQRLIVPDLRQDHRFAANPFVLAEPGFRFYAGVPIRDAEGRVLGAFCILDVIPRHLDPAELRTLADLAGAIDNVLDIHRQKIALRETEANFHALQECNPQLSWSAAPDGTLELGPRAAQLLGQGTPSPRTGWATIVAEDELPDFSKSWLQSVQSGEPFDAEHRLHVADGSHRWFRIYAAPRHAQDGGVRRWHGTLEDITDRRDAQARIAHLAYHDSLTGLPNRARFTELLQLQLDRSAPETPIAVLNIDLDNFKRVNDTLGHPAGDTLLRVVAQRIGESLRPPDTAARFGGDEFCAVVSLSDKRQDPILSAGRLAARLLQALRAPFDLDGHLYSPHASIGLALGWQGIASCEEMQRRADLALYRAKAEGRDTFRIYTPELDAREQAQKALASDLEHALHRNELELVFLPTVDLRQARIRAFEALMRWRHPVQGVIAPEEFLQVAEKTGVIVDLGAWVLAQACRAAAHWPEDINIAVNLSAAEFRHRDLRHHVEQALAQSGIAPHRLRLELIESMAPPHDEAALAILAGLRELGVKFVMDDFGTGYSALNSLRRANVDAVKIDRSLVATCADDKSDRASIRAIISLSRAFGIVTIGEGVESLRDLEVLCSEGCDYAQGFLFSKPVAEAVALAMIEEDFLRPSLRVLFDNMNRGAGTGGVVKFTPKEVGPRSQNSAGA